MKKYKRPLLLRNTASCLGAVFAILVCQGTFTSCHYAVSQTKSLLITQSGVFDLIELHMAIDDFALKGYAAFENRIPLSLPGHKYFLVPELDIEFETRGGTIIRIWFFSENCNYKIMMPKDGLEKELKHISVKDIVHNFGPVRKYVDQTPPKHVQESRWAKYRPFGIEHNTVTYLELPFSFGLNWDDTLSYITVSYNE